MMGLPENIQEIILARLIGRLTCEQELQLREWLAEDVRNQREYRKFCAMWYSGRWGQKRESVDRELGWLRLQQHRKKRRKYKLLRVGVVAASVLFVLGVWSKFYLTSESEQISNKKSVKETEVTLILSSGDSLKIKEIGKIKLQEEGSLICADSSIVEYVKSENENKDKDILVFNELIVPKSKEFRLRLADGSLVIMNSESKLRYPTEFVKDHREVYLEGEACFEVSKDSLKPFIVHTLNADVQVLGTLFNVAAYVEEKNTEVTLVDGVVQVTAGKENKQLKPGEQLLLNRETDEVEIRKVEASNYIAWTQGLFRFDAMPLHLLMLRLKRWYDISYEFRDESLKNIRFTGGFHRNEDIHFIVDMIEKVTDVAFRIEKDKIIIDRK